MSGHSGTYGWVFGQIRVDPSDDNTIYTLGLGLNVSHDAGKTFTALKVPHGDHHGLWIDPANPRSCTTPTTAVSSRPPMRGAAWKFAVAAGGAQLLQRGAGRERPCLGLRIDSGRWQPARQGGPVAGPGPHPCGRVDRSTRRRRLTPLPSIPPTRTSCTRTGSTVTSPVTDMSVPQSVAGAARKRSREHGRRRFRRSERVDPSEGSGSARPVDGADHRLGPQTRPDLRRLPVCLPVTRPWGHVGADQRRSD